MITLDRHAIFSDNDQFLGFYPNFLIESTLSQQTNVRDKSNLIFNSALPVIFAVPKYAKVLNEVVKVKGIKTNFKHNLIEVNADAKEAIFENLETKEKVTQKVSFIQTSLL